MDSRASRRVVKATAEERQGIRKEYPFLDFMIRGRFELTPRNAVFAGPRRLSCHYAFVSVFEGRLNEEEAAALLNHTPPEVENEWDSRHRDHLLGFRDQAIFLRWRGRHHRRMEAYRTSDIDRYLEDCWDLVYWPRARHIRNVCMLLPEYGVVYYPVYDYTNIAFFVDPERASGFLDGLQGHQLNRYRTPE